MISSLQSRYILSLFFKRFSFLLGLVYAVYILFDYTLGISRSDQAIPLLQIVQYYTFNLIKRLDLLFPLCLLLASIGTLFSLNIHNELVACLSSGRNIKRVLKPLIVVAMLATTTVLLINQFILPKAQAFIDRFEEVYLGGRNLDERVKIRTISYENGSRLLFGKSEGNHVFDAYFFPTPDEVWHFKELEEVNSKIVGHFVDRLKRSDEGKLVKVSSTLEMQVPFIPSPLLQKIDQEKEPFENLSLIALFAKKLQPFPAGTKEPMMIAAQLYHKLAMPWFSLLVVMGIIPFCTRFDRHHNTMLVYTLSLLAFVSFFTIMDACVIIGENNIVSPSLAIFGPFIATFTGFGIRYAKL